VGITAALFLSMGCLHVFEVFHLVLAPSWGWELPLGDPLQVSRSCPGWVLAARGSECSHGLPEGPNALWEIKSSYSSIRRVGWKCDTPSQGSVLGRPGRCFSLRPQGPGASWLLGHSLPRGTGSRPSLC